MGRRAVWSAEGTRVRGGRVRRRAPTHIRYWRLAVGGRERQRGTLGRHAVPTLPGDREATAGKGLDGFYGMNRRKPSMAYSTADFHYLTILRELEKETTRL